MSTNVPILEAILHPPLGALTRELITGTFTGAHDFTRTVGPVAVNAYGLAWDIFTLPAGWGITYGQPNVYEPRLLQANTIHTGFDGHDLVSEYHDFYTEGIYWLWANPFPTRVHVEISPGVVLVFHWLIAL